MNIMPFKLPPEQHKDRQRKHDEAAKSIVDSMKDFNFSELDSKKRYLVEVPDEIPMASNPKWVNRNFGAVSTVEKSGCIALTAKVICDFLGHKYSMEEIIEAFENGGYRLWKLGKRSKTLGIPRATLNDIKKEFPEDQEIQKASTLSEIYVCAGKPEGIGGSAFAIDAVISLLAIRSVNIYSDTRIKSIYQILENLEDGIPVPVRVENSIYHSNPSRKGGHYVTLFGILYGYAVVVDTSFIEGCGVKMLPAKTMINAMLGNEKLVCAWNLRPCVE